MCDESGAPISVDFGPARRPADFATGFVIPENPKEMTSPEKRLMREKSDETMIKEKMTRDQLIELARKRKTDKTRTDENTMSKLTQILENRGRFKSRHSRKEDKFWRQIETAKHSQDEEYRKRRRSFENAVPLSRLGVNSHREELDDRNVLKERNEL
jgi:hypothetical protein